MLKRTRIASESRRAVRQSHQAHPALAYPFFLARSSGGSYMNQITCTPFAALLLCLALAGCGGGSGTSDTSTTPGGGDTTIQGVSTPSSVSVVTAKNAQ